MKELKAEAHILRRNGLGKVVDTIFYRQAGLQTPLYWSKEDCKFGVYLGNKAFRDADAKAVKDYAVAAMKAIGTLEWKPVILVMDLVEPGEYHYSHQRLKQREVSFHFDRFYAADMPDGSVRAVAWDVPDEKRMTSFTNTYCWEDGKKLADLPFRSDRNFFFPYTAEMWAGIEALSEGIDQLRKRLRQLLRQDDVQQVISNAGTKMLYMLAAPRTDREIEEEQEEEG